MKEVTNSPMYDFDFELGGMLCGNNKTVFDLIATQAVKSKYFQDHMVDQHGHFLPGKYAWFKSVCSTRYTTLKKKHHREQKSLEERDALAGTRRVQSRKLRVSKIKNEKLKTLTDQTQFL